MQPANPPLEVLYEDNHLLVVNKPAGLLTQPSGTNQDSLEERAKLWIKHKYHKPGKVFLEAVHRLDKPASGVVVFGRTSKAVSRLNEAMRGRHTRKIYYALVEGSPPENEKTCEHYLVHDAHHAYVSTKTDPLAKKAVLSYKTIKKNKSKTVLEIELETGRYHQIRVQLAAIGFPIVGDKKYGSKIYFGEDAIALHHFKLEIAHPVTKEELTFVAPVPWPEVQ